MIPSDSSDAFSFRQPEKYYQIPGLSQAISDHNQYYIKNNDHNYITYERPRETEGLHYAGNPDITGALMPTNGSSQDEWIESHDYETYLNETDIFSDDDDEESISLTTRIPSTTTNVPATSVRIPSTGTSSTTVTVPSASTRILSTSTDIPLTTKKAFSTPIRSVSSIISTPSTTERTPSTTSRATSTSTQGTKLVTFIPNLNENIDSEIKTEDGTSQKETQNIQIQTTGPIISALGINKKPVDSIEIIQQIFASSDSENLSPSTADQQISAIKDNGNKGEELGTTTNLDTSPTESSPVEVAKTSSDSSKDNLSEIEQFIDSHMEMMRTELGDTFTTDSKLMEEDILNTGSISELLADPEKNIETRVAAGIEKPVDKETGQEGVVRGDPLISKPVIVAFTEEIPETTSSKEILVENLGLRESSDGEPTTLFPEPEASTEDPNTDNSKKDEQTEEYLNSSYQDSKNQSAEVSPSEGNKISFLPPNKRPLADDQPDSEIAITSDSEMSEDGSDTNIIDDRKDSVDDVEKIMNSFVQDLNSKESEKQNGGIKNVLNQDVQPDQPEEIVSSLSTQEYLLSKVQTGNLDSSSYLKDSTVDDISQETTTIASQTLANLEEEESPLQQKPEIQEEDEFKGYDYYEPLYDSLITQEKRDDSRDDFDIIKEIEGDTTLSPNLGDAGESTIPDYEHTKESIPENKTSITDSNIHVDAIEQSRLPNLNISSLQDDGKVTVSPGLIEAEEAIIPDYDQTKDSIPENKTSIDDDNTMVEAIEQSRLPSLEISSLENNEKVTESPSVIETEGTIIQDYEQTKDSIPENKTSIDDAITKVEVIEQSRLPSLEISPLNNNDVFNVADDGNEITEPTSTDIMEIADIRQASDNSEFEEELQSMTQIPEMIEEKDYNETKSSIPLDFIHTASDDAEVAEIEQKRVSTIDLQHETGKANEKENSSKLSFGFEREGTVADDHISVDSTTFVYPEASTKTITPEAVQIVNDVVEKGGNIESPESAISGNYKGEIVRENSGGEILDVPLSLKPSYTLTVSDEIFLGDESSLDDEPKTTADGEITPDIQPQTSVVTNDILNSITSIIRDTEKNTEVGTEGKKENISTIENEYPQISNENSTTTFTPTDVPTELVTLNDQLHEEDESDMVHIPLELILGEVPAEAAEKPTIAVPLSALESEDTLSEYLNKKYPTLSHVVIKEHGSKVAVHQSELTDENEVKDKIIESYTQDNVPTTEMIQSSEVENVENTEDNLENESGQENNDVTEQSSVFEYPDSTTMETSDLATESPVQENVTLNRTNDDATLSDIYLAEDRDINTIVKDQLVQGNSNKDFDLNENSKATDDQAVTDNVGASIGSAVIDILEQMFLNGRNPSQDKDKPIETELETETQDIQETMNEPQITPDLQVPQYDESGSPLYGDYPIPDADGYPYPYDRPPARKDDSGHHFGGEPPFYIKLPGSQNAVPLYIEYEPVQVKYVPMQNREGSVPLPDENIKTLQSDQFSNRQGIQEEINAIETNLLVNESLPVVKKNQDPENPLENINNQKPIPYTEEVHKPATVVEASSFDDTKDYAHINIPEDFYASGIHSQERPDPFVVMPAPDLASHEVNVIPDDAENESLLEIEQFTEQKDDNEYQTNTTKQPVKVIYQSDKEAAEGYKSEQQGDIYGQFDLENLNNPVFKLQTKHHSPSESDRMNPAYTPFPITANPSRFTTTESIASTSLETTSTIFEDPTEISSTAESYISPGPEMLVNSHRQDIHNEISSENSNDLNKASSDYQTPSSVEYSSIPAVDFRISYNPSDMPKFMKENPKAFPDWYPQSSAENTIRAAPLTSSNPSLSERIASSGFAAQDNEKIERDPQEAPRARHSDSDPQGQV